MPISRAVFNELLPMICCSDLGEADEQAYSTAHVPSVIVVIVLSVIRRRKPDQIYARPDVIGIVL